MTPDEIRELRRTLAAIDQTHLFFYCPEGDDGFPLLYVDRRRLDPRRLLHIQKVARTKIFVRGHVERTEEGPLLFLPEGGEHTDMLSTDLEGFFTQQIPDLEGVRVQA